MGIPLTANITFTNMYFQTNFITLDLQFPNSTRANETLRVQNKDLEF